MSRRVVCAVREGTGWHVLECARNLPGWRLNGRRVVSGATVTDLLASIHDYAGTGTTLAIGLERARLVVRMVRRKTPSDQAFPHGLDLALWERPVNDVLGRAEMIACPREQAARLFEETRAAGFPATVLFPVWAVVHRGAGKVTRGAALVWEGGGVVMGKGGFGPWHEGETGCHETMPGIDASLRGGLSYALCGVPEGWSAGRPARAPMRGIPFTLAAALLAALVWGGVRGEWIRQRAREAQREGAELTRVVQEARLRECTTADIAQVAVVASRFPRLRLNRLLLSAGRLTLVGIAPTSSVVEALGDSLGITADEVTIEPQDDSVGFRMEFVPPCAR